MTHHITAEMKSVPVWGGVGGCEAVPMSCKKFVTRLCFHSHGFAETVVSLPEAVGNFSFSK